MQNVLVVDDDQSILQLISDALASDYQVFTAETVPEADSITQQHSIDLLIADLVIPEKNGIDMIMEFRKRYPDMQILAISGGGGITGRFDYLPIARLVGAADTLKKPFSIIELRDKVRSLIKQ
jgi:DNA-binding response OmpR family regulator